MNKTDSNVRLQQLEQGHTQLIEELDTLNHRLEHALSSFSKPAETSAELGPSEQEAEIV